MKIIRPLIIVFLLAGFAPLAIGQNLKLRNASDVVIDPSISQSDVATIRAAIEKALNEYAAAAKLVDPEKKRVNEQSIDRFSALFSPNARVVKDYAEYPPQELIPFKDYALDVFNQLQLKGVEVIVEKVELLELKADALGFYVPVVMVQKRFFNSLSADGKVNSIAMGKTEKQRITFDIYKDDLERANISKIDFGEDVEPPEQYTRLFQISAGVGSATFSPGLSAYWDEAHSASSLDVSGGINFSIGVEWMTDRFITPKTAPSRKLAFSVGLRYASYQFTSELRDFGLEPFDAVATSGTNTARYRRLVDSISADEELRFGTIEIPLGVAFALRKTQRSLIYLHARLVPTLVLGASGDLTGTGIYDGILYNEDPTSNGNGTLSEFRILREMAADPNLLDEGMGFRPYQVGRNVGINESADPDLQGLAFAIQLSPTAYFNFSDDNPGWGLLIGLDLSYHLGSFMKHDPVSSASDDALKFSDDFEGSILDYYADDLSGFSFGLRIGLFQRLGIDP